MDLIVILAYLSWLAERHYATAQLSRSGLYLSVRNETGGPMCITDVPTSIRFVRSFIQCVALCRSLACCVDFNVIDGQPGGSLQCQMFDYNPLHFAVQRNCAAYQHEETMLNYTTTYTCNYLTATITCPKETRICVQRANYGRLSTTICLPSYLMTTTCRQPTTLSTVKRTCQGSTTCSINLATSPFGDPCPGYGKYLEVSYYCEQCEWRGHG